MTSLRTIRYAVWAAVIVALAVIAGTFYWQSQGGGGKLAASLIGGPFTLTDQHGATVTEAALKGHPSAMFFGYTYCPDVCPTTLYDLSQYLQQLGPDGDKLKVYFVTVDPERDTQAQMATYLGSFDPRITGLTGSRPAIDQVLKEYRIYSKKVPQDGGNYIMDHSASVYLFDKDGTFTSTLDYQEKPDVALAKLKRLIAEG
jgi:protein SCO1/2